MKKRKHYEEPSMKVFELKHRQQLLVGSNPATTSAKFEDYEDGEFTW